MKQKYQLCNADGILHYVKLTKKHWWSRWEIEWDGHAPKIYTLHGVPAISIAKEVLVVGVLTWFDIRDIVKIAIDLNPMHDTGQILSEFQTEESFYQEILKRYKEKRNG